MASVPEAEGRHQRERMLQVILDSTSAAMLLVSETGTIVFTNVAARRLFFEGREAKGENFLKMLGNVSEPLRRALLSDTDQIFTFDEAGDPETYHLSKTHFVLDGQPHALISVRHMTLEISRQELSVLKKTLRIIGHELANSMAPASSLLRSARQMLSRPDMNDRLATALQTVEERLVHLNAFVAGLAHLGQLPKPRQREVAWPEFVNGLRALWPDVAIGAPPTSAGWFDPIQIQQVLINLVKNAHEAGGPREGVSIDIAIGADGGSRFSVLDRGPGMSDEVISMAIIPSFTTKDQGSGMGLALCREIVEGHAGRLRIGRRRDGAGTEVSFWLPPRAADAAASRARLTLTGVG
jgi:two-component system, NtrC family, nitrogen regulation sensor histidine kinase NtrY